METQCTVRVERFNTASNYCIFRKRYSCATLRANSDPSDYSCIMLKESNEKHIMCIDKESPNTLQGRYITIIHTKLGKKWSRNLCFTKCLYICTVIWCLWKQGLMTVRFKKQGIALFLSELDPETVLGLRRLLKPHDNTPEPLRTMSSSQINRVTYVVAQAKPTTATPKYKAHFSTTKQMHTGSMNLTEEQRTVVESIQAGNNVFFTGSAGTAKSYLLQKIKTMFQGDEVAFTAPTGIAACNISV